MLSDEVRILMGKPDTIGDRTGMLRRNRFMRWGMIFLLAVLLTACGSKNKIAENDPEPEPIEQEVEPSPVEPEAEEPPLPYTYPLTGIGTEQEAKDRPVAVMVENSPKARPQSGLDQADIVYEILAEGEITRFVAVYQSKSPEVIGPVRSIRPYFVEIGAALDAYVVHAGWSPDAMALIRKLKLAHFDQVYGDHAYYWRDKSRKAPHNLYTSVDKIREGAADKQYRETWNEIRLNFLKEDQTAEGEAAAEVTIPYLSGYKVSYRYDETLGAYLRSMAGEPHVDKETGETLIAYNVLICKTSHKVLDDAGRRAVDVHGPGEGYLLQQGKIREVTWQLKDGLIRAFADGEELPLVPGTTWIQIVPTGSDISYS
jgi:hypothetical protein